MRDARYLSITVGEVTSHNKEMMPLCVRFVDSAKNIREEFLQFSTLPRVTGEAIAKEIRESLQVLHLNAKNLRGQEYDGAANMASKRVGVQSLNQKGCSIGYIHTLFWPLSEFGYRPFLQAFMH